jgi:DNA uptake protein ComE-like DNA-binding protein
MKVNINKATEKELMSLKYVGAKTAQRIIHVRVFKPYRDIHELSDVKGIGKFKMQYFIDNDLITV